MNAMNQRFKISYQQSLFLVFVITASFYCFAAEPSRSSHYQAIAKVVNQFKRRVTVLELGSADYSLQLIKDSNAVCVAVLLEDAQKVVDVVKMQGIHTLSVLAPASCGMETIKNLGRCEHFDIVIIHENGYTGIESADFAQLLTNLGEYVFIETSRAGVQELLVKGKFQQVVIESSPNKGATRGLFLSSKPKTFLAMARYSQRGKVQASTPHYFVKSSFDKKFFSKKSDKRLIPWVDGINLVTFVLLKGIYPDDDAIRGQIAAMLKSHPHHNDLVIGNMIVQGDRLVPIDCTDSRRSAKISKCVGAALNAFKKGNKRLQNPYKWIDDYYDLVSE